MHAISMVHYVRHLTIDEEENAPFSLCVACTKPTEKMWITSFHCSSAAKLFFHTFCYKVIGPDHFLHTIGANYNRWSDIGKQKDERYEEKNMEEHPNVYLSSHTERNTRNKEGNQEWRINTNGYITLLFRLFVVYKYEITCCIDGC